MFLVQGHSYRKFGYYGAILKKKPVVESTTEYLNVIKLARNNPKPFDAKFCNDLLKNQTKACAVPKKTAKLKENKFPIQKYVKEGIIKKVKFLRIFSVMISTIVLTIKV